MHDIGPNGNRKTTDHFDEHVLTLAYEYMLRGFTKCFMPDFFGVSLSSVTFIPTTWINVFFEVVQNWQGWLSTQEAQSLPKSYPASYSDIRIILHCTEFYLDKQQNCTAQANTYSQYKYLDTVMVIIWITPREPIKFALKPYGGNTSDRHIAVKYNFTYITLN